MRFITLFLELNKGGNGVVFKHSSYLLNLVVSNVNSAQRRKEGKTWETGKWFKTWFWKLSGRCTDGCSVQAGPLPFRSRTYSWVPVSHFPSRSVLSSLHHFQPQVSNWAQSEVENEFSDSENLIFDIFITFYFILPSMPVSQFPAASKTGAKTESSDHENVFLDAPIAFFLSFNFEFLPLP